MKKTTKERNTRGTSVSGNMPAPLVAQPVRRIEDQHTRRDNERTINKYDTDWFEALPGYEKGILIGGVIFILAAVIFGFGVNENTVAMFVTAFLSLALLIVAGCQAYIYKKQAQLMREGLAKTQEQLALSRETNDVAQQSLIFSQRAYITAHLAWETEKKEKALRIQNSGNTPANDVIVHYYTLYSEIEPEWQPHLVEDERFAYDTAGLDRLGLITPHQEGITGIHQAGVYSYIPHNPPADWSKWNKGNVKLYCWGRIEYSDIFREPRDSTFAFVYCKDYPNRQQCSTGNSAY